MNNGFITLHRKILDWEWYDDLNTTRLFIHCLLRANHKDNNWRGILIQRGSFLTSINTLSKETKLSTSQIRTSLKKLKSTSEIASKSQAQYSVITMLKYDQYQTNDKVNDKLVTSQSQANDKPMTTNNNDNNDNKKKRAVFVKPTTQEINDFAFSEKLSLSGFEDYYESNGWKVGKNKMKVWKAAASRWSKNQSQYSNQQPDFSDTSTDWVNKDYGLL